MDDTYYEISHEGCLSQLFQNPCWIRTLNGMFLIFLEYSDLRNAPGSYIGFEEGSRGLNNIDGHEATRLTTWLLLHAFIFCTKRVYWLWERLSGVEKHLVTWDSLRTERPLGWNWEASQFATEWWALGHLFVPLLVRLFQLFNCCLVPSFTYSICLIAASCQVSIIEFFNYCSSNCSILKLHAPHII